MTAYNTELTKVYRLYNKKKGYFHTGGHSAASGVFISLKAVKGVITFNRYKPEEWEIKEYDLVEVKHVS